MSPELLKFTENELLNTNFGYFIFVGLFGDFFLSFKLIVSNNDRK